MSRSVLFLIIGALAVNQIALMGRQITISQQVDRDEPIAHPSHSGLS